MSPAAVRRDILARRHWIFDMDGTLTVAVHDFEAIRAELGLAPGVPILEALAGMPADEAAPLWERLDAIELGLARGARAMPGVAELLETLSRRGVRLGIVTRNKFECAQATLAATGLDGFFPQAWIMDRAAGAPKPQPDALLHLMRLWGAPGDDVVMLGDYLFDLEAGRAAGAATVYVDYKGSGEWRGHADLHVERLDQLLPLDAA